MASLSGLGLASSSSRPPVGKALGFIVWLAVRCAWAYCARVLRPSGLLLSGILGSLCMGRPVRASTWASSCWPRVPGDALLVGRDEGPRAEWAGFAVSSCAVMA